MANSPNQRLNPQETSPGRGGNFSMEKSPAPKPETSLEPKEAQKELAPESPEQSSAKEVENQQPSTPSSVQSMPQAPTAAPPPPKSPTLMQVESILEENMAEAYSGMDQATQIRFRQEGEKTSKKIEQVLYQVKLKVKNILDLIRNWLKIIPGVSGYYIEQETKIKTDKIMSLRNKNPKS